MSDKKNNEILEEQRKAREEFLRLKRMQKGTEEAPPKPSEIAIVPTTPLEKLKNFWFHEKVYVIVALILAVIIGISVVQCSRRKVYDLKIAVFSYEMVGSESLEPMADYFEQYCEDINGDGEVNIQILNCSYNRADRDAQYQNAMYQKLTSIISAEPSALLYITDEETYEYLCNLDEEIEFFEGEPVTLPSEFYEASRVENSLLSYVPQNLQIACRNLENTLIANDKNIDKYYEQSQKILAAIIAK